MITLPMTNSESLDSLYYLVPAAGVLALIYAYFKAAWVKKQDAGTERMKEIAGQIQDCAMAFLRTEYKVLSGFVVVVAGLLVFANTSSVS